MTKQVKIILLILALTLIAGSASLVYFYVGKKADAPSFCAADVRECPDGSFVSRIPPDCGFSACPEIKQPAAQNGATTTEVKPITGTQNSSSVINTEKPTQKPVVENKATSTSAAVPPQMPATKIIPPTTTTPCNGPACTTEVVPIAPPKPEPPAAEPASQFGTLTGEAWIACPSQPCDNERVRQLLLTSETNPTAKFTLSVQADGRFSGRLPAGTYRMIFSECPTVRCKSPVGPSVTIKAGVTTYMKMESAVDVKFLSSPP